MSTLALDKAIFAIVTNDATCAALLVTRFYPGGAPQDLDVADGDYCVYDFSGSGNSHSFDGRDDDATRKLSVFGFSSTATKRLALSEALKNALDPVASTPPPWPKVVTVSGESVTLQHCLIDDDGETFKEYSAIEGGEILVYGLEQTYDVKYTT